MFDLYYTAFIILAMAFALAKEWLKPSITVFSALVLLILGGVITTDDAFVGFSNKGMITVGFLFIVSAALQSSASFEKLMHDLLGGNKVGMKKRYIRLLFPVAGMSAFLNNTPIVASLIPVVKSWAKKNNLAASKFLIPLSYAAILGGTCTLIGTSTNLIVHGMLIENGGDGISFFEITKIGLPVALVAILFMTFLGNKLLPSRKGAVEQLGEQTREFVAAVKVGREYPNLGKSIEEANLRHLQGLFLFQIIRNDEIIAPVAPEEKIQLGDRLFFTGLTDTIYDLQKTPGLQVVKDPEFDTRNLDSDQVRTYEAVVSTTSPLIGETVRDSNFRDKYNGVILAIHRSGSRVNKKVGDIIFQPADTLFILAKKGFDKKYYHSRDFSLVSPSLDIFSKPKWKGNVALILLLLMVVSAALNIIPIVLAAALTAILMVLIGIISTEEAQKSVNWGVILIIACSFGIARAIENSGLAAVVASGLIDSLGRFGPVGVVAGLFIVTSTFTWVITNNAVAALMFPVALSITRMLELDPHPFMLTLMMGASTCFATPIGYQTNMMVYGTGGYKFSDFLKIGVWMNLLVGTMVTIMIYLLFFRG